MDIDNFSAKKYYFDTICRRQMLIPPLAPMQEKCEQKWHWYHSWSHKSYANLLHWGIFGLYSLAIIIGMALAILGPIIIRTRASLKPLTSTTKSSQANETPFFRADETPVFSLDSGGLIKAPVAKKANHELAFGDQKVIAILKHRNQSVEIIPEISVLANNSQFTIKTLPSQQFIPGKYQLKVQLVTQTKTQTLTQDFTWGVLAMNLDQSVYRPNQKAFISMAVLDDNGRMVCNAKVDLTIADPQGKSTLLSTQDETIKISDECFVKGVTNLPDYYTTYQTKDIGNYVLKLKAETKNGIREITDQIKVEANPDFIVKREGPTRIFPPELYKMKLTITARDDFAGSITETIPEVFRVTEQTGLKVKSQDGVNILTWQKHIPKGKSGILSYEFKAPDKSPQFYLVGPLKIQNTGSQISYTEGRSWQIAADAITAVTIRGEAVSDASTTTLDVSPDANITVGKIVFVSSVSDNNQTTDGASTFHSVADTDSHTWTKVTEWTETDGAANDGVTVSLFATEVVTQIDICKTNACTGYTDTGDAQVAIISAVTTTATVGASLSVTVNAVDAAQQCNGATTSITTTASTVPYETLTVNADKIGAHNIDVSTNAVEGYTGTIEWTTGSGEEDGMDSNTNNIDGFDRIAATNDSPETWAAGDNPSGVAANANSGWYGYTSSDATLSNSGDGVDRFTSAGGNKWAPFDSAPYEVAYSAGAVNAETTCVGHKIEVNAYQPAGVYTGTVEYVYTAIF